MSKARIAFLYAVVFGVLFSCATILGDGSSTIAANRSSGDVIKESIDPNLLKDENKIIFLRKVPSLREYGYEVHIKKGDYYERIAYEKLSGKYGWVLSKSDNPLMADFEIYVEDGYRVYGTDYRGALPDIAYVDELEKARELVGSHVWFIGSIRSEKGESYSPDKDGPERYDFSLFEQFTLTDVTWDCIESSPVKFFLDDGDGNIRHWSGTVVNLNNNPFEFRKFWNVFTLEDPRETHPYWLESDWSVIKERKIKIGMTKEMLLMSLGDPEDINRTVTKDSVSEQFVYGDQYVYLENGVVTAWQD